MVLYYPFLSVVREIDMQRFFTHLNVSKVLKSHRLVPTISLFALSAGVIHYNKYFKENNTVNENKISTNEKYVLAEKLLNDYHQSLSSQERVPVFLENIQLNESDYTLKQLIEKSYQYHEFAEKIHFRGLLEALALQAIFGCKPNPENIIIDISGNVRARVLLKNPFEIAPKLLDEDDLLIILGSFLITEHDFSLQLAELMHKNIEGKEFHRSVHLDESLKDFYSFFESISESNKEQFLNAKGVGDSELYQRNVQRFFSQFSDYEQRLMGEHNSSNLSRSYRH